MLKRTQKSHHNNKLQMMLGKVKLILYIQKVILSEIKKKLLTVGLIQNGKMQLNLK
jgi:hypothetical protein